MNESDTYKRTKPSDKPAASRENTLREMLKDCQNERHTIKKAHYLDGSVPTRVRAGVAG